MSEAQLEQALRDLKTTGRLVKDRPYRQVWRFEMGGKGYYLKFYPRAGAALKRLFRGDPAMREFARLQWLQKAGVPAPRAAAVLKGFRIDKAVGDAVILEGIEPAVALDELLHREELSGERVVDRYDVARQVREIVRRLAKANLGHSDLHLGNFLLKEGRVYLIDGYAVRRGGVRLKDLMLLGHSAQRWATRADVVRGWRELGPAEDADIPRENFVSKRLWRKAARRAKGDNRYVGRADFGDWKGYGFRSWKFPFGWSAFSQTENYVAQWELPWYELSWKIRTGEIEYLKRSRSGDVMAATIILAGRPMEVVIKGPKRKQWHRWVTDVFRGDRALRAWERSWDMIVRDVAVAWPLLVVKRTVLGYPVESYIVFERVTGAPLARARLDEMTPEGRERLFRRVGRLLRRIDDRGFYHRDAKSDNIMATPGEVPVLVDLDGIRKLTFGRWSLPRLLKSMKLHKEYKPSDSLALCQGYAPAARVEREMREETGGDEGAER